jgi:hypothetical protein
MFATAGYATPLAFAVAVILGSASPALASDRLNDKPLPQVDFTLASNTPIAEAIQVRPVSMPVADSGSGSASLRRTMYVSFAALQVMDAISTRKAISGGATEANPAMAGIAGNSAALFAVKAGTAVATTFFVERLAKNHPRRATIIMAVLNTAYAGVVAHNYRVARAQ